ncbi:MAG TPA: hypothetical protein IAA11_00640 [Candidatus Blautia intestinigallinarum]|nr:hypothetical protein [Candidatus Blautia intestinigallinarum]
MDLITLSYLISCVYYVGAVSYLYSNLMTAKPSIKRPFILTALLLTPMFVVILIDYHYIGMFLWIFIIFPLFLYQDPWKKRFTCYITIYLIMLVNELLAVMVSYFLISLLSEKGTVLTSLNSSPITAIPTSILTVLFGTFLTRLFVTSLKPWFSHIHSSTLALLGLPLVIVTLMEIPYFVNSFSPLLIALFFPPCYALLLFGFRRMHLQELLRNQRFNRLLLIEKQILYSKELEKEYQKLRRWNHDIDNHFLALSYLLQHEKYEESSAYIKDILQKKN